MSYLTRGMTLNALQKMHAFHNDIVSLYKQHNMDLLGNLGRRNIVMSQAQEKFFAQELSRSYSGVIDDGKTGQPDIIIEELQKELECKLTSRHKGGGLSFQSDHQTLVQKGELDYLYVIANETFDQFVVLHFEGLTSYDFRAPSNGSRGKVAMFKHRGMKKCHVPIGTVIDLNKINLEKLAIRLQEAKTEHQTKIIKEKIRYWSEIPNKYRFEFEALSTLQ